MFVGQKEKENETEHLLSATYLVISNCEYQCMFHLKVGNYQ